MSLLDVQGLTIRYGDETVASQVPVSRSRRWRFLACYRDRRSPVAASSSTGNRYLGRAIAF